MVRLIAAPRTLVIREGRDYERYLRELERYLERAEGTDLHAFLLEDRLQKAGLRDGNYYPWLPELVSYLVGRFNLRGKRVLDIGCGTGEFAVSLARHGYDVSGIDTDGDALQVARQLAGDAGVRVEFTLSESNRLPYEDKSFDLLTLFSVLEHVEDGILVDLLAEMNRISRGVVYLLVPNRLKMVDDHTGLPYVPWMPHAVAALYLRIRNPKFHYKLAERWDVHYRTFFGLRRLLRDNFTIHLLPEAVEYPAHQELIRSVKVVAFNKIPLFWMPLLPSVLVRFGVPAVALKPYMNLALVPAQSAMMSNEAP